MKAKVETANAPFPGKSPHSQAIIANNFVFTQGSICLTSEGRLLEGTIEEQIHQTMRNLQAILDAAGGKVTGLPVEIPGVGQYVSFNDTEENTVSMLQPSIT